jgi:hypothetical protein
MICAINLAGEAAAEFEKTDSKSEKPSTVGKIVSNSIPCYRVIFQERQNQ